MKTPSHTDCFPTETHGLPEAHAPESLELADGEQIDLRIAPVVKTIGDTKVRMLAYNGSIPGPVLWVRQGSELVVKVVNEGDLDTTVHWHGLRLDNRYDGTTETQQAIPVGGNFTYRLTFPDPGVYWYHPHIREDYTQEMGLYGNIVVVPTEPDYWPAVHRELTLTLDDILLEAGKVAPFHRSETTYSAMGRFGNVLLVNGEPEQSFTARQGEVLRLYLTNTANTRVFNVVLDGARMKLVGGDSGRCEREQLVENVIIAPSERAVIDVLFSAPGQLALAHRTPHRLYPLAAITVIEERAQPPLAMQFATLRTNPDLVAERSRIASCLFTEPDKTLALIARMDLGEPELPPGAVLEYFCPMHSEVISDEPGKCPKCSMKLLTRAKAAASSHGDDHAPAPAHGHAHGEHAGSEHAGSEHAHDAGGIEWEDDMVEVNRMTTPANTRWQLIDRATGAEGAEIDWRFHVGDQVKIRVVNEMDSDHPMHHPFHIHGAGRFLVLSRDGVPEPNLVWKDTVLVPTGQVVDILLDVSNPGRWMAHCHIAEHHESGMMFSFTVEP
jgi:FtsP/CotA-like multicopper oxidase with cupredoxin domain